MKFKQLCTWNKYLAAITEDGKLFFIEPGVSQPGQPVQPPQFTLHSIEFNVTQKYPMPGAGFPGAAPRAF